jgi:hypothetical protein
MTVAQFTGRWGIRVQADEGRAVNAAWTAKSFAGPSEPPDAKRHAALTTSLLAPSSAVELRCPYPNVPAGLKAELRT